MIDEIFLKDKNYEITNCVEIDDKIIIDVKSKSKICKCPECGTESNIYHSTYKRIIQDTPIHNTETWLNVTAYEFECSNEKCKIKTFAEQLSFAKRNKVKTNALIQLILSISIFLSSTSASLVLSFLGVKVSADVIDAIIKNIEVVDNPDVEEIGIDDVAIRKGITYATAIYDMKDHNLIALLEGRDADIVKGWLEKHKKIKMVARDRASAYASAISEVLPECIQVADRFHLFVNLIEHLKDIFYKQVPEKIFIKDNKIVDASEIKKVPKLDVDEEILNKLCYDNSPPTNENGNRIEFDSKFHSLDDKQYIVQTENRIKKMNNIIELRKKLKESNCHEIKDIAKEFNISTATLRKYSKMTDEEVLNIANRKDYKKRKPKKMDNYSNIIYKMIVNDWSPAYIVSYVKKIGCNVAPEAIKKYIFTLVKNNNLNYNYPYIRFQFVYPEDVTIINRYDLLKYLLSIKKPKDKKIDDNIQLIFDKYPIAKDVKEIFKDFHDTIFSKDEEILDVFIEIYKNKIEVFCNGVEKDIAPIKNAISLQINSGFVEGNNNKFKLIKRILYGKSKLCNLFKKSFLSFLATTENFDINDVVEGVLKNY